MGSKGSDTRKSATAKAGKRKIYLPLDDPRNSGNPASRFYGTRKRAIAAAQAERAKAAANGAA